MREGDRWFAAEASRDPKAVLRGRLEALGPDRRATTRCSLELEAEGVVLRTRIDGRQAWCDRRLLARIHRYTLDRLRREIEPVTAAQFLRFLACWQHVDPEHRLEGPRGVAEVIAQLAGFEVPAAAWEASVLPARVRGYKREWLDQLTLSGEVAWGRLWGAGSSAIRRDADLPRAARRPGRLDGARRAAADRARERRRDASLEVDEALRARGAMFLQELARATKLPRASRRGGLDGADRAGPRDLRLLRRPAMVPRPGLEAQGRERSRRGAGACSRARRVGPSSPRVRRAPAPGAHRRRLPQDARPREAAPARGATSRACCRTLEARGEVRGGRFVAGFDGEQYALPEAVTLLRAVRRRGDAHRCRTGPVSAADPLNFRGILTPDERVAPTTRKQVLVA